MTWKEYYAGVRFIKQNSGTEQEEKRRLKDWKNQALPLVGKTIDRRAGERVYL